MPVTVNLRHLEEAPVELEGQVTPEEIDLVDTKDELVSMRRPLDYNVEVVRQDQNLLVSGELAVTLDCNCSRCLKPFEFDVELQPYNLFVPLEGEEAAPVHNDLVDLLPFFREDVLLAFPQHPLCSESCRGIANAPGKSDPAIVAKTDWSELDKLKLKR